MVDFSGSPVEGGITSREVEVESLPETSEMVKLKLHKPGQSATLPTVVSSSPFPAGVRRAEPRSEIASKIHDVVTLPGPDPTTIAVSLLELVPNA